MSKVIDRSKRLGKFVPEHDDNVIICRCEEITKGEIRMAVHAGMYTMNEVKRYLRAGMGLCQGQTCSRLIRRIIAAELGVASQEIPMTSSRAPMRPVTMGVYRNDSLDAPENRGESCE